jgi:hypothetical protein
MANVTDFPWLLFAIALVVMWGSTRIGVYLSARLGSLREDVREDYDTVQAATLTLLGLLIGFSFSMAINRYDQRKNYEEAEANAIGTEYVRADLLPAPDGARVRALLRNYLGQRTLFYMTGDTRELRQINARTAQLQTELWSAVVAPAARQPLPLVALAISGMNDVLNSQGYSQAAGRNRIPLAAWSLVAAIAMMCTLMLGFGARNAKAERVLLLVVPLVVSIAFLLIADIDSPRSGIIRVIPLNLTALSSSLSAQ